LPLAAACTTWKSGVYGCKGMVRWGMSALTYPILTTVMAVGSERGQCPSARRIGCSDLAAKKEVSKKK